MRRQCSSLKYLGELGTRYVESGSDAELGMVKSQVFKQHEVYDKADNVKMETFELFGGSQPLNIANRGGRGRQEQLQ